MTKLYVIENPDELIGKTIAYVEMNAFHSPLVLVTADGGIMAWETDYLDDFNVETVIYDNLRVEAYLFKDMSLQNNILAKGICQEEDFVYFLAKQTEKRRKEREIREKQQEESDRKEYERLKEKFGGCDNENFRGNR